MDNNMDNNTVISFLPVSVKSPRIENGMYMQLEFIVKQICDIDSCDFGQVLDLYSMAVGADKQWSLYEMHEICDYKQQDKDVMKRALQYLKNELLKRYNK